MLEKAVYNYHDERGQLIYQVVRYEPKDFRVRRPGPNGEPWIFNLDGVERTLYRLPELLGASAQDWVFICEGEKDVNTLYSLGFTATTSGCSTSWRSLFSRYFAGRLVCIVPDMDEPGAKYAQAVASDLVGLASVLKILILPVTGEKKDVSDWVSAGGTAAELIKLIDASPIEQLSDYVPREKKSSEGVWRGRVARASRPCFHGRDARGTHGQDARATQDALATQDGLAAPHVPVMEPVIIQLSHVTPVPVEWLWPNRFPLGKLSLLVGDPGLGKSYLSLYIASIVSRGGKWPDDTIGVHRIDGSVLLLSAEDDLADTIYPRLHKMDADLYRVASLDAVICYDDRPSEESFNLCLHIPALEKAISERGDTKLVIIDPISAFMGKTDSHKNAEVRSVLSPLSHIANKYRVAVIAVSHLSKAQGTQAIYRTLGSLAFTAAARAVWLVTADPNNNSRRLLTPVKANLSVDPGGLAFQIADGIVTFETGRIDQTADEVLAPSEEGVRSELDEAKEFLRSHLSEVPMPAQKVIAIAKKCGICDKTMRRAKDALHIQSFKQGNVWFWRLDS